MRKKAKEGPHEEKIQKETHPAGSFWLFLAFWASQRKNYK
jgi:hypothetical protein